MALEALVLRADLRCDPARLVAQQDVHRRWFRPGCPGKDLAIEQKDPRNGALINDLARYVSTARRCNRGARRKSGLTHAIARTDQPLSMPAVI